jgi:hypothetical protein
MSQKLHNLFKNIQEFEPPEGLEGRIVQKIAFENKRQIKRKRALVQGGILVSLFFSVYGGLYFGNAVLESDFWNLAKLLFSDGTVIASFWKSFLLSLLETFPVLYAVAILIPVLVLLLFISLYSKLSDLSDKSRYNAHYITI